MRQVAHYLRYNPVVPAKVVGHLARSKVAIPLDILRWLAVQPAMRLPESMGHLDRLIITGRAPWVTLDAWLTLVGDNPLRAGASIRVSSLDVGPQVCEVTLEISGVTVEVLREGAPLSQLIAAGIIDVSQPTQALSFAPTLPPWLTVIDGQCIRLNLMKHPAFALGRRRRRLIDLVLPWVCPRRVEADGDWLVVTLERP